MAARKEDAPGAQGEEQAQEQQGEGKSAEEKEPKSRTGGFGTILVPISLVRIALGVLVLGALTAGSFFLVVDVIGPALGPPEAEPVKGTPADEEVKPKPEQPGLTYKIDDMVVNPVDTRGRRFLRLGVAFETKDGPAVIAELTTRDPQVRDILIREFSSRTLEELTDPTVREEVRLSCIERINEYLTSGKISNMYFTDYVIQ